MQIAVLSVFLIQGFLMAIDEFVYHHRRGLRLWERVGHPIDTLFYLICFSITLIFDASGFGIILFSIFSLLSLLVITKDEFIHHEECEAKEQWLHSLLFIIHPIALFGAYYAWSNGWQTLLAIQTSLIFIFMCYQVIYWNFLSKKKKSSPEINNEFYNDLHDSWYEDNAHPIALLRLEQEVKNPWVEKVIKEHFETGAKVLDIGCGAGFLTNHLAQKNCEVHGVDMSETSLAQARQRDKTQSVVYQQADAYNLPYPDKSFDVVCAMDFLEHVDNPEKVVAESARVLKPGGLFFYHTFNRNFISWLVVIKFIEWFMPNTPKNIHVIELFIKPEELLEMCRNNKVQNQFLKGLGPRFNQAFVQSILTRTLQKGFKFEFKSSLKMGYIGFGQKD